MNNPSRSIKALAAAGAMSAVALVGVATASAASAATIAPSSSTSTSTRLASPTLTTSLKTVVWQPPYGCFVCGLGGWDPTINFPIYF